MNAAGPAVQKNVGASAGGSPPPDPQEGASQPGPDAGEPFRSLGFTLSTLGFAVSRRFRDVLGPLGLEPREFALLRAVAASQGQPQNAIAERLRIPASRMVAYVDALEARGLIERRRNPDDRRARELHLTGEGRELLGDAFAVASDFERRLCARLDEDERERLLTLLQGIASDLGLAPGVHAAHAEAEPGEPCVPDGE